MTFDRILQTVVIVEHLAAAPLQLYYHSPLLRFAGRGICKLSFTTLHTTTDTGTLFSSTPYTALIE